MQVLHVKELIRPLAAETDRKHLTGDVPAMSFPRPEEISMIGAEIEGPPTGAYFVVCEDRATPRYRCMA